MIQHLINHVALVVDKSTSMTGQPVIEVFDAALARLKQRSIDLDQETRISIFLFGDQHECLAFDMDVMRFKSLADHYRLQGSTALIDATISAIADQRKLPELYGDHSFLLYVITDGQENRSAAGPSNLRRVIDQLPAENWTVACLVPDAAGKADAKKFGFPDECIAIWDTNSRVGFEKVGQQFSNVMDRYMTMRASGTRSTKSLFSLDASALSTRSLDRLHASTYEIYPVRNFGRNPDHSIKTFVESWTKEPYRLGSAYYMPTEKVEIQNHKKILVQDTSTGHVYTGANIRQLLGLPAQTVRVEPADHTNWRIFVQSTSVNRKLFPGTFVLVMR